MKRPTNIFLIAFIMLLLLCHCGRDNSSQKEEIPDYLFLGERTNEKIMGQYWIDDGRRTVFIRGGDVISNEKIAVEVAIGSARPYYLKDKGLKLYGTDFLFVWFRIAFRLKAFSSK